MTKRRDRIGIKIAFPLLYSFDDKKKNSQTQPTFSRDRDASFKRLESADFSHVDRGNLPATWPRSGIAVSPRIRNLQYGTAHRPGLGPSLSSSQLSGRILAPGQNHVGLQPFFHGGLSFEYDPGSEHQIF